MDFSLLGDVETSLRAREKCKKYTRFRPSSARFCSIRDMTTHKYSLVCAGIHLYIRTRVSTIAFFLFLQQACFKGSLLDYVMMADLANQRVSCISLV